MSKVIELVSSGDTRPCTWIPNSQLPSQSELPSSMYECGKILDAVITAIAELRSTSL